MVGTSPPTRNAYFLSGLQMQRTWVNGVDNVYEFWVHHMKVIPPPEDDGLKDFPLESVCGEQCIKIIETSVKLLELCDPNENNIARPIRRAALTAVEIVCFG